MAKVTVKLRHRWVDLRVTADYYPAVVATQGLPEEPEEPEELEIVGVELEHEITDDLSPTGLGHRTIYIPLENLLYAFDVYGGEGMSRFEEAVLKQIKTDSLNYEPD